MKNRPLVSIIVPIWNTGKSACELIKKLLSQNYEQIEIIAVDDGSTDNSLDLLKKLARADKRLVVKHQKNAGASVARNTGIDLAKGEYIIFLDSDDDVANNFVEKLMQPIFEDPEIVMTLAGKMYNKIRENKVNATHVSKRRARRKNEKLSDYIIYLMILDGRMYGAVNKVFQAKAIKDKNIRFESGRNFAEDTKFTIDYLRENPGKIGFILEPLYIYNFGTETSTVYSSALDWKNWERSYQDLEDWARAENGGTISLKTRGLLSLIRLRWHISHYRAKKRARK